MSQHTVTVWTLGIFAYLCVGAALLAYAVDQDPLKGTKPSTTKKKVMIYMAGTSVVVGWPIWILISPFIASENITSR